MPNTDVQRLYDFLVDTRDEGLATRRIMAQFGWSALRTGRMIERVREDRAVAIDQVGDRFYLRSAEDRIEREARERARERAVREEEEARARAYVAARARLAEFEINDTHETLTELISREAACSRWAAGDWLRARCRSTDTINIAEIRWAFAHDESLERVRNFIRRERERNAATEMRTEVTDSLWRGIPTEVAIYYRERALDLQS